MLVTLWMLSELILKTLLNAGTETQSSRAACQDYTASSRDRSGLRRAL